MSIVYLIHAKGTNLYKIGLTSGDPVDRLGQLQTSSPHELGIRNDYDYGDNAAIIESYLHGYYKEFHVRGEWFRFSDKEALEVAGHMTNIRFGYCLELSSSAFDGAMSQISRSTHDRSPMLDVALALRDLCYYGGGENEEDVWLAINSLLSHSKKIDRSVYYAAVGFEVDENGDEV